MAEAAREIGQRLRRALESGSFDAALPLIEAYGQSAKEALQNAVTAAERTTIVSEANEFLQDRLHLARVLRSHLAARLAMSSRTVSYAAHPNIESTWQIDG